MEITFYRKLAYKVADAVVENQTYSDEQVRKIRHGLVCIFSDLYKFLLFFIIFSIFSLTKEILIAFLGMTLLRPFVGGFHAKKEVTCIFLSFAILFISVFWGSMNLFPPYIQFIFMGVFPLMGFIISPVKVNKIEKGPLKLRVTAGLITLAALLLDYFTVPGQILVWTAILTYLLAIYQLIKNLYSTPANLPAQ